MQVKSILMITFVDMWHHGVEIFLLLLLEDNLTHGIKILQFLQWVLIQVLMLDPQLKKCHFY